MTDTLSAGGRSTAEIEELVSVAEAAADAARSAVRPFFRATDLVIDNKTATGFDPVTEADRKVEEAITRVLRERRPGDAILGEEYGTTAGESGLTWVIDPIDGTRAFMSGAPTWGVLIALSDARGPFLGLIDQPFTGERFLGAGGLARFVGPHGVGQLRTRGPRPLSRATVMTTYPEVGSQTERAGFEAVASRANLVRYGLDCYAYALVALGHVDLVIEAGLQPYDIAAPIAVIEAAGGRVTNWSGGPAHEGGQVIAAANEEILAEALAILRPFAAAGS